MKGAPEAPQALGITGAILLRSGILGDDPFSIGLEIGLLAECESEEEYLKASRAGFTVPLVRPQRAKIWRIYQGAIAYTQSYSRYWYEVPEE